MHKRYKDCPECEGRGTMTYERVYTQDFGRDVGFIDEYEDYCSNCGGDGQVEWDEDDYAEYEEERGDWLMDKHFEEEMERG
jgi:DnaJ-class molecular chaperone